MKAIVLLSGGADSTVTLAEVLRQTPADAVTALFFHYGQKAEYERAAAMDVAEYYQVKFAEINIPQAFDFSDSGLLSKNPKTEGYELKQRNTVLLSLAVSYAQSVFPNEAVKIYYGAYGGYSDCTEEYVGAFNALLDKSTGGMVRIYAPFMNQEKFKIYHRGLHIGAPLHLTRSCYEGGVRECGKCPACMDKQTAFIMAAAWEVQ